MTSFKQIVDSEIKVFNTTLLMKIKSYMAKYGLSSITYDTIRHLVEDSEKEKGNNLKGEEDE